MSPLSVLIVGAGPAGLMAACELARRGLSFRVVDKKAGPTDLTNAAAVHARTLEIFAHVGIAERLVAAGQKWTAMTVRSGRKAAVHLPLDRIDSSFGGSLLVPQSVTERLLETRLTELGGRVEWLSEVLTVEQDAKGVRVSLTTPSGVEVVESAWLIACDGLHSLVRSQVGIEVEGEDIESRYLVCDVALSSTRSPREVVAYAGDGSILGLFPLGDHLYRAIGNLTDPDATKAVVETEIRSLIEARSFGEFKVDEVRWSSPFWIHSKMAKHLRSGRIFLAGDAAHVHSPAGGQGMNTGIQDVYNLSWKLALVTAGHAPESLLESYEAERRPVIRSIVHGTEALTKMALSKSRLRRWLRVAVMGWLNSQPRILGKIAARLTQLSLGYRGSPLLLSQKGVGGLRPGDRAPDVVWRGTRLYEELSDQVHTVLVFHGLQPRPDDAARIQALEKRLQTRFGPLVHLVRVEPNGTGRPGILADEGGQAHRRYGLPGGGLVVVRPDQYLSFLSVRWSESEVEQSLEVALGSCLAVPVQR